MDKILDFVGTMFYLPWVPRAAIPAEPAFSQRLGHAAGMLYADAMAAYWETRTARGAMGLMICMVFVMFFRACAVVAARMEADGELPTGNATASEPAAPESEDPFERALMRAIRYVLAYAMTVKAAPATLGHPATNESGVTLGLNPRISRSRPRTGRRSFLPCEADRVRYNTTTSEHCVVLGLDPGISRPPVGRCPSELVAFMRRAPFDFAPRHQHRSTFGPRVLNGFSTCRLSTPKLFRNQNVTPSRPDLPHRVCIPPPRPIAGHMPPAFHN